MVSSQELRDLGAFWSDAGDALSIYFEPSTPSELSHREETIEAKERIQQAIGTVGHLQVVGSTTPRAFLRRAIETIADMEGNHGRAKVIFAAARKNLWREFDLPGKFGVRVETGNSFAIAPLLTQQENQSRYCVLALDREHERVFLLEAGEFKARKDFFAGETEKVRTTGARKSSHIERSKEEPVHRRLHSIGRQLAQAVERGSVDAILLGCRDEMRAEIEEALPREIKRRILGRFHIDPGAATPREIQEKAEKLIAQRDRQELRELAARAMDEAAGGRLGAVGLADVAQALERGEVRLLLLPDPRARFSQAAWLCSRCGHLDLDAGKSCSVCGGQMRLFPRADEALVRKALATGTEIRSLRHASAYPESEVGAWLRFRIEGNLPQALAS
jgi:rubrerythrin